MHLPGRFTWVLVALLACMQHLRGLIGVATTALPVMPVYWDVDPILVLAGIKHVPPPSAPTRVSTFNIWEWDRE
jgi:hypothetical protein